ncbi:MULTISPECIES: hypothetical protein [Paenibacillus]|uniref:hypothetical protein n=1 Tax=Paenibacillus TaxID=44249 RepID=UPI0003FB65CA|nr:hypothetical protein [Paenibacillus humicus]CDN44910.1 hypothetical protein BN871_FY_00140 [Paenibacillus sp. P22]
MSMNVNITNHMLCVGSLELVGVAAASLLQIGDTDSITLYSIFDTPPESVIIGPFAPLPAPAEGSTQAGAIQNEGGQTVVPLTGTGGSGQAESASGSTIPFGNGSSFVSPNGSITISP